MTSHEYASSAGNTELVISEWMRKQRQARGWSVPEMRRHLREAAKETKDTLPSNECLGVMIRRWEKGVSGLSERYRMHYCRAFGISLSEFGTGPLPDDGRDNPATQIPAPAPTPTTPVALSANERAELGRLRYEYAALARQHDMLKNTILSWAGIAANDPRLTGFR